MLSISRSIPKSGSYTQLALDDLHVFVAAARNFADENLPLAGGRAFVRSRPGRRRSERGNDALQVRQCATSFQSVAIRTGQVFRAPLIGQGRVLGTNRGVVEARRHGV